MSNMKCGITQIGLVELMLCAYDLCTHDYSYIWFDKEKLIFENYDPDIHGGSRYIY
ncbi:MAG: hypothetical protein KKD38_08750 [Candidatus Delongbacteria bacterium]|nr:hypothetical protein [Candidatus Delongbacteria bacterium]